MSIATSVGLFFRVSNFDVAALKFFEAVVANGGTLTEQEKNAVNGLVKGFKDNGTWNKYLAIYPIVGGSAASHAINLKDPTLYELSYVGSIFHTATGMRFDGSTGYADTGLLMPPATGGGSFYARLLMSTGVNVLFGVSHGTDVGQFVLYVPSGTNAINSNLYGFSTRIVNSFTPPAIGNFGISRVSSSDYRQYRNGVQVGPTSTMPPEPPATLSVFIGAENLEGGGTFHTDNECAFAEFNTGLTPAESAADYETIDTFQAALSRQVILHTDTQAAVAYLASQGVTLTSPQLSALDRLVRDLHGNYNAAYATSNLWIKMRAIYPYIGGTAAAHTLNLRNPSLPLVHNGLMTHSATGCLFQGGYSDTGFNMLSQPTLVGASYYSRNDDLTENYYLGSASSGSDDFCFGYEAGFTRLFSDMYGTASRAISAKTGDTKGLIAVSRVSNTDHRLYRNGIQVGFSSGFNGVPTVSGVNVWIGAMNVGGSPVSPTNAECAYADINYGLTPLEETHLYNAVNAYNTALARTPVLYDPDAQAYFNAVSANSGSHSPLQRQAINQLVLDFKATGTWAKKKAIYPFYGNSLQACQINLRNPATGLLFYGSMGVDWAGVYLDGTTAYMDTSIIPSANFTSTSGYMSMYTITPDPETVNSMEVGAMDAGGVNITGIIVRNGVNLAAAYWGASAVAQTVPTAVGWTAAVREGGNTILYKNGVNINSVASATGPYSSESLYIGAANGAGAPAFANTNRYYCYVDFGDAHTAAEMASDYISIQAYQTTLGRSATMFVAVTLVIYALLLTTGIIISREELGVMDLMIAGGTTIPDLEAYLLSLGHVVDLSSITL